MGVLDLLVLAAAAWTLAAFALLWLRMKQHGRRALYAAPAGSPDAGVRYAFTAGLHPRAKESVREHPLSYAAGMAYHAGTFTAFGLLGAALLGLTLPASLLTAGRLVLVLGLVGGVGLLLKRILHRELRGLSNPDDYLSNALVTAFLALGLTPLGDAWLLSGAALLIYMPMGKIRHCVFFFSTRAAFGAFFGRRGVFPVDASHGR